MIGENLCVFLHVLPRLFWVSFLLVWLVFCSFISLLFCFPFSFFFDRYGSLQYLVENFYLLQIDGLEYQARSQVLRHVQLTGDFLTFSLRLPGFSMGVYRSPFIPHQNIRDPLIGHRKPFPVPHRLEHWDRAYDVDVLRPSTYGRAVTSVNPFTQNRVSLHVADTSKTDNTDNTDGMAGGHPSSPDLRGIVS